jgi:hypothetical protein
VQVQPVQHFPEQLFLLALQMMPLADQRRVGLGVVAGDEAVVVEQPIPPPAYRIQLRGVPSFGLVPQEGLMRVALGLPRPRAGNACAVRSSGPVHLL